MKQETKKKCLKYTHTHTLTNYTTIEANKNT